MKKEITNQSKYKKFFSTSTFIMSNQQYRLSLGSNSSIGPFDDFNPNTKSSWLCNLCNGSSVVNDEGPTVYKKSKINLSKITKTVKLLNPKTIVHQNVGSEQKLVRNSFHRMSLKSPPGDKLLKSMHQSNIEKPCTKIQSSKVIRSNQPLISSTIDSSTIKSQCNVYTLSSFSQGIQHQSRNTIQPYSQKFIPPKRNIQNLKPQQVNSSHYITTTGSSLNQKSQTDIFKKPIIQLNLQQRVLIPQISASNYFIEQMPQYRQIYRKPSIKNSSKFYQNFEQPATNFQIIQNPHDPHLFEDIKLADSIDRTKEIKLKTKKSNSSGKSKGSKFIMNMRRVTSRSQAPDTVKSNQSASSSLFGQLGNKIQIGIRKVESFNSEQEDEDQYSQVLSHGQKSFLMTEINEVSERSRISSASRFKFWEQHEKNPQN